MKKYAWLISGALVVVACFLVRPRLTRAKPSFGFQEHAVLITADVWFEVYATANAGRTATNWSQLEEVVSLREINRRWSKSTGGKPLHSNYVFVTEPLPMLTKWKGHVVLMRVTPLQRTESGLGRYVVSRMTNGFLSSWISEPEVQAMLSQTNQNAPSPKEAILPK